MVDMVIKDKESFEILFQAFQEDENIDITGISFQGFPKYEMVLRGDDFEGGIPTRLLPAIMSFQKALYVSYSLVKYGEERRLTKEERNECEVIVKLNADKSTTIWADAAPILNRILSEAVNRMTGTEITIAILGTVVALGGYYSYKAYLNKEAKKDDKEALLKLSQEETKRLEIATKMMDQSKLIERQVEVLCEVMNNVVSKLKEDDKIVFEDDSEVAQKEAREITRKPREVAVETRLDGDFKILSVDSGSVKNGFKIKVQQVGDDGEIFIVTAPEGTLSEEQIEILQNGEWKKEILHMEINANKAGERIYKATLVEAGLKKAEE